MMRHPMWLGAALLGLFGIIGSTLVALTYQGTAERIARNEREAVLRQIHALLPPDSMDNDMLHDTIVVSAPDELGAAQTTVYRARLHGRDMAVVFSPVIAQGYNGAIKLIIAVRADGSLAGVRVLSHRETPGLGDKIDERKSDWVLGFSDKSLDNPPVERWLVKRDGGDFDQFTGATITPRGVVKAVKQTLIYFQQHRDALFAATNAPAATDNGERP